MLFEGMDWGLKREWEQGMDSSGKWWEHNNNDEYNNGGDERPR